MAGQFDIQGEVVSALCNYTPKAVEWLEANLTQEQLDALASAILPELTETQVAERLYLIGGGIKRIGVERVAAATGQSTETISEMLTQGTAVADAILAADARQPDAEITQVQGE